jgi:hypothetical protein
LIGYQEGAGMEGSLESFSLGKYIYKTESFTAMLIRTTYRSKVY